MSDHAVVSVVVPGFMVGGSAPIAWTTVPPRTGVWAGATAGRAASTRMNTATEMSFNARGGCDAVTLTLSKLLPK